MTHAFIAFEGIDGSGKTTLRKYLYQRLERLGIDALSIIQMSWLDPSATEIITRARFSGRPMGDGLQPSVITAAYVNDKLTLGRTIIEPHLRSRPVLCDRYLASDLVYHQELFGVPIEETASAYASEAIVRPTIQVFVDTPPDLGAARLSGRTGERRNPWDAPEIQARLYHSFCEIFDDDRYGWLGSVVRIDNSGSLSDACQALDEQVVRPMLVHIGRPYEPSDAILPIQDAWELMADGMHVHRYFLGAADHRRRRVDELRRRHKSRPTAPVDTGLGVLEHLWHPDQPEPTDDRAPQSAPAPAQSIAGAVVVARDPGDRSVVDGPLSTSCIYEGPPSIDVETVGEVGALIDAAGLGYLLGLTTDVIVTLRQPSPPMPRIVWPGTVWLLADADGLTSASSLLVQAALTLLHLFEVCGGADGEPGETVMPVRLRSSLAPITELVELGVWHRLAVRGRKVSVRGLGDMDLDRVQRTCEQRVDALGDRAYQFVDEVVTDLNAADLVRSIYPGRQQFARYASGLGIGQAT